MFEMRNRFDLKTSADVVNHRFEMIQMRIKEDVRVENILIEYDVSRPVFYKFVKRYKKYGRLGLHNLSRAPLKHGRETAKEKKEKLLSLHKNYPYFSSYELNTLVDIPTTTIQHILKKHGLKKSYLKKSQKKIILEKLKKEVEKERRRQKRKAKNSLRK